MHLEHLRRTSARGRPRKSVAGAGVGFADPRRQAVQQFSRLAVKQQR